ncbi:Trace amine-associated receptor 8c [Channa argus]|uniref:Trace amine-associated receptor 8c n=1 Tax=Channa argus TaxID=215402 RepID=A0A6G1PWI5_CHAAH|nr:Trace amine-associated receptor 8c [Channa argus]
MEDQDRAELCFPQLFNSSCRKPEISQSDVVLMDLLFFICVFTVTLNLLVIISVSHFRQLHTPTNLLILSLAVSDFLTGLDSMLEAHKQTACWFLGDIMCSLHVYVSSIFLSVSTGDMVLISVDRYVAICDPLHYSTRVTVTRVKICICISWICSVVYYSIILKNELTQPGMNNFCYGQCVVIIHYISGIVDSVLSVIAPVTVIIILYMRVFVTAVSQARAMRSHVAAVTLQHSGTVMNKKSELKAARTLGVVVLVFLMCFCPYYCISYVQISSNSALPIASGLFLSYINPCLNPVIYALFYPWFRKAIRLIFSLQILQPGSRETNML